MTQTTCPACNQHFEGELARRRGSVPFNPDRMAKVQPVANAPWYRFRSTALECPICGVRLRYGTRAKLVLIATTVVALSATLVAATLLGTSYAGISPLVVAIGIWLPFYVAKRLLGSKPYVVV